MLFCVALTLYMKISDLGDHRFGIDLAHVAALIRDSNVLDVQVPLPVAILRHAVLVLIEERLRAYR